MRLVRLVLKNFRSYRDADIGFGDGLLLVLGENGSGKTSILEAIRIALFKESNERIDELVHQGSESMKVSLEFVSNGNEYRVERERRRGSSTARLFHLDNPNSPPTQGDREVSREIRKILGIDGEHFLNAIYVKQGEIDQLINESAGERKKIIAKLLGIESLQTAWEGMRMIIEPSNRRRQLLEAELRRAGDIEGALKSAREIYEKKVRQKEELERKALCHRIRLEAQRARLKELDGLSEKYTEIFNGLRETEERIADRQRRVGSLNWELEQIARGEARMAALAKETRRIVPMERLGELIARREQLRSEIEKIRKEIELLESRFREVKDRIRKDIANCSRILGREVADIQAIEEAAQDEIQRMDRELKETRSQREGLVRTISSMEGGIVIVRERMEALRSAKGACPVCEAPLTEERRAGLLDEDAATIAQYQCEIERIRGEEKIIASRIEEITKRRDLVLRTVNIAALRGMTDQQTDYYDRCEERLSARADRERELSEIEREISGLESEAGVTASVDANTFRKEWDRLRLVEREYHQLTGMVNRRGRVQEELSTLQGEIGSLMKRAESLRTGISMLKYDKKAHEELREATEQTSAELHRLELGEISARAEMESATREIERLEGEMEKVKSAASEIQRIDLHIARLQKIRNLFGKDGVQRDLRMIARPIIERNMRTFFSEFNFEYSDVQLDEDYEITLFGPSGKIGVGMMSGGERIAVAIAMRLALAKALAGGAVEAIMLDEPTIHLDTQRRRDLIQVFKRLGNIPQMLVVTHDEELQEVADTTIMVRKTHGISSAQVLLPDSTTVAQ
ncbi:MAG: AAA family ATPase [Methanomicrobiales archaeon]|nr:AAA family ATPase [Methanomicrobiales archaeon]